MGLIKESGTVEKAFKLVEVNKEYTTWSELLKDYVFFTPALLYWHTGLDRDLVSDFINQNNIPEDSRPKKVVVSQALFDMENPVVELTQGNERVKEALNYMLYVCPRHSLTAGGPSVWEMLDEFITSISFVNAKTGYFAQAMRQPDLHIFDYQAIFNMEFHENMNIPVAAWGLYSNKVSTLWRIKRSANGRYSTPIATVVESTKMTIEEAEKLFKEIY